MSDITDIKRELARKAAEVSEHLLPRGSLNGRYWHIGSTKGEPGDSLRICVRGDRAGAWSDFAEAGESGDMIDLWGQVRGLPLPETLSQIRAWLGIYPPEFEKRGRAYRRPEKPKCSVPKSAVLEYLTSTRKLSQTTVSMYRVGERDRTVVFPSLLPDGSLVFVKYLNVDRDERGKKKSWVEAECEPVLFGWQAIDLDQREVTITEGEIDAMSAYQYGKQALSLPFGGGGGAKHSWIESEYERLSQFEVIYLALDMDEEGEKAVGEICNRLGQHRCRRVKLPKNDLNECLVQGIPTAEIVLCFDAAKTLDPPELMQAGSFADAVVNLFHPKDGAQAGYRLPFRKIEEKLLFRPSELTEWTGATGTGKSMLLGYSLISMADQGARVCMASLEMAPAQLIRRMVKQAGCSDKPSDVYIRKIIGWFDEWLWLFGHVGKAPVKRLLEVFEYARARYGCDVFAVDSLMRLGLGADDYSGQEKAVFELVNWTVAKGVHLHLVAHSRKADKNTAGNVPDAEDIKGTSEIASNAFNIIGLWRDRKAEEMVRTLTENLPRGDADTQRELDAVLLKPPVLMNIAKQRNGDWEGKCGLWFNQATYQYRTAQDDTGGRKFILMREGK